jgi:hypothetical protein
VHHVVPVVAINGCIRRRSRRPLAPADRLLVRLELADMLLRRVLRITPQRQHGHSIATGSDEAAW